MGDFDGWIEEDALALFVHFPIEKNVFRQPHVVVKVAVTFKHLAPVCNICGRDRVYNAHRSTRYKLLEFEQVSGPTTQTPRCAVGKRAADCGVRSLTMTSDHAIH